MFWPPVEWNKDATSQWCLEHYQLIPRYGWIVDSFGGRNPKDFETLSNVIFANGLLDPWIYASITEAPNPLVIVINIEGAAHGVDLSAPRDDNPPALIAAQL